VLAGAGTGLAGRLGASCRCSSSPHRSGGLVDGRKEPRAGPFPCLPEQEWDWPTGALTLSGEGSRASAWSHALGWGGWIAWGRRIARCAGANSRACYAVLC
jgi:hypothetical protein